MIDNDLKLGITDRIRMIILIEAHALMDHCYRNLLGTKVDSLFQLELPSNFSFLKQAYSLYIM